MGTQGSGSNNDLFLGSNAYRLITKSEIPVMTIKEKSSKKDTKTFYYQLIYLITLVKK